MLKHVLDSLPQEFKIVFGEARDLARQVCRHEAFATIEAVGYHVLATHLSALLCGIFLSGYRYSCNGHLLRDNGIYAAGKRQLNRTTNLPAVQAVLHKRSHHRAKSSYVIEGLAHKVR